MATNQGRDEWDNNGLTELARLARVTDTATDRDYWEYPYGIYEIRREHLVGWHHLSLSYHDFTCSLFTYGVKVRLHLGPMVKKARQHTLGIEVVASSTIEHLIELRPQLRTHGKKSLPAAR